MYLQLLPGWSASSKMEFTKNSPSPDYRSSLVVPPACFPLPNCSVSHLTNVVQVKWSRNRNIRWARETWNVRSKVGGVSSSGIVSRLITILECGFCGGVTKVALRYIEVVFLTREMDDFSGDANCVHNFFPILINVFGIV